MCLHLQRSMSECCAQCMRADLIGRGGIFLRKKVSSQGHLKTSMQESMNTSLTHPYTYRDTQTHVCARTGIITVCHGHKSKLTLDSLEPFEDNRKNTSDSGRLLLLFKSFHSKLVTLDTIQQILLHRAWTTLLALLLMRSTTQLTTCW